jgi:cellulose synthase/poly-beta-1,6-N-acetylglucosamine synthase-like glycosyltransferase
MDNILEIILWLFIFIVAYVYLGYPLLLLTLFKLRNSSPMGKADITPAVSFIIPAYNEEKTIAQKIVNSLNLNYPKDRLEIIIVSDGSTDRTNEIVKIFIEQGVKFIALDTNQGKSCAQNKAVSLACGDILFFTDANVMLRRDAARIIVNCFKDNKIGCVVGKVAYVNESDSSVSQGEGFYWRYELFLRELESKIGNLAMGSGPIMAIRRALFQTLDPNAGEDFVLPIQIVMKGYRVIYEPEAISEEILFQNTPVKMVKSKIRIVSKDLRGLYLNKEILNPFRFPLYAWGLISHKLLRWLVPYFLIVIFFANLFLLSIPFYLSIFIVQIFFYIFSIIGYVWQKKKKPPLIFALPFSFSLVNLAALIGVGKSVAGKKSGKWETFR